MVYDDLTEPCVLHCDVILIFQLVLNVHNRTPNGRILEGCQTLFERVVKISYFNPGVTVNFSPSRDPDPGPVIEVGFFFFFFILNAEMTLNAFAAPSKR